MDMITEHNFVSIPYRFNINDLSLIEIVKINKMFQFLIGSI